MRMARNVAVHKIVPQLSFQRYMALISSMARTNLCSPEDRRATVERGHALYKPAYQQGAHGFSKDKYELLLLSQVEPKT